MKLHTVDIDWKDGLAFEASANHHHIILYIVKISYEIVIENSSI